MEMKIEAMKTFLEGGIEAVFNDRQYKSKVKKSKNSSREDKLIKMLGCDFTAVEFFSYLKTNECELRDEELEILGVDKIDYVPVKLSKDIVQARKVLRYLQNMISIDIVKDMTDFINTNQNFKEMSDAKLRKAIASRKKSQTIDPMQLLFEMDMKRKSSATEGKTPIQILQELIDQSGKVDDMSNVLAVVTKSDKQGSELFFKDEITMKVLLEAMLLHTNHLYKAEYDWLASSINEHVWNIYMLPYLEGTRREMSVYFLPFLELLSRRSGISPGEILDEIIKTPEPVIKDNYTLLGTVFKDTVFIKDDKMAVIDETVIKELNLEELDFDNRGLVENGIPVKDIYFKFQTDKDNYLIKRGVI